MTSVPREPKERLRERFGHAVAADARNGRTKRENTVTMNARRMYKLYHSVRLQIQLEMYLFHHFRLRRAILPSLGADDVEIARINVGVAVAVLICKSSIQKRRLLQVYARRVIRSEEHTS